MREMAKALAILPVLLVSALSGCGTCMNLEHSAAHFDAPRDGSPATPFGGVTRDLYWGTFSLAVATQHPDPLLVLMGLGYLFDTPLSAVGDAATLPWVLKQADPSAPANLESCKRDP